MQTNTAAKLPMYAVRSPRLDVIGLSKLTGESPKTVREVPAHLGRN